MQIKPVDTADSRPIGAQHTQEECSRVGAAKSSQVSDRQPVQVCLPNELQHTSQVNSCLVDSEDRVKATAELKCCPEARSRN